MKLEKKAFWSVAAIILAVISIWAVIHMSGMSPGTFWQSVCTAAPGPLAGAVVCSLGFIYFEGRAVLSILKEIGYPRSERSGFLYAAADYYFSAITPSATGGQPASAFFMVRDGVPPLIATAVLLLNMIMYNAAVLTIGIACLVMEPGIFRNFQPGCKLLIVAGFAVLLVMAFIFGMLLWYQSIIRYLAERLLTLGHKLHIIKKPEKWERKLLEAMAEYKECVTLMAGRRIIFIKAYFFNLLQRSAQLGVTLCAFLALHGEPRLLGKLWVTQCFVAIGSNCVPIPGSMGVTDYLMLDGYMNQMERESAFHLQMLSRGLSFYCCVLFAGAIVLAAVLIGKYRGRKTPD